MNCVPREVANPCAFVYHRWEPCVNHDCEAEGTTTFHRLVIQENGEESGKT